MKAETANRAVAEAMGWTLDNFAVWHDGSVHGYPPGTPVAYGGKGRRATPNFMLDLNACHQMEASLTDEEFARYMQNLGILIAERTGKANRLCERLPLHAKAEWRTETYLRLKGKWTE